LLCLYAKFFLEFYLAILFLTLLASLPFFIASTSPITFAVLSSNEDLPIAQNVCFAAEVGLTGEIRPVNRIDQRISEAQKLGFEKIYISTYNLKGLDLRNFKIEVIAVTKMEEVFTKLFG
jgi:DNA repair protein RadA/Sms